VTTAAAWETMLDIEHLIMLGWSIIALAAALWLGGEQ
jgi:hypothetical protein